MYNYNTYQIMFSYQGLSSLPRKYSKYWSWNDDEYYSIAQTSEYELAQAHIKIKKNCPEIRLKMLHYSEINSKTSMFKSTGSKLKPTRT